MLHKIVTGALEATAFARQAVLLPRDAFTPVVPERVGAGEHAVVFLHGLFASAGVLRPMRERVGRHAGLHVGAMSYPPGPGIAAVALRLERMLARLPESCHLHLVGHSLGGIVSRYYAVTRDDPRLVSTIALATPFGGVAGASWLGFEAARDLDPDGPVLRTLRVTEPRRPIPHLSVVAGADAFASSPVAHALPSGDVVVLAGVGHNAVLFDSEAMGIVERRVLELRQAASAHRAATSG